MITDLPEKFLTSWCFFVRRDPFGLRLTDPPPRPRPLSPLFYLCSDKKRGTLRPIVRPNRRPPQTGSLSRTEDYPVFSPLSVESLTPPLSVLTRSWVFSLNGKSRVWTRRVYLGTTRRPIRSKEVHTLCPQDDPSEGSTLIPPTKVLPVDGF